MKYVITESQLNKLSSSFLDDIMKGYEVKIEKEELSDLRKL